MNRPYEVDDGRKRDAKTTRLHARLRGIFDKLEKAIAFDSDEINAIMKDLGLLKLLFKSKMEQNASPYLKLVTHGFNDKDVDDLVEYLRDKERRKAFFKEFRRPRWRGVPAPVHRRLHRISLNLCGRGEGVNEAGVRGQSVPTEADQARRCRRGTPVSR